MGVSILPSCSLLSPARYMDQIFHALREQQLKKQQQKKFLVLKAGIVQVISTALDDETVSYECKKE